MNKFMLAASVLAMTATAAAAEVTVSGSARMGLIYDGSTVGLNTSKVKLTSRVRVNFGLSGETDSGLAFGAAVRADQSGQGNTANGDSTVFISGAFGKLTFGDVDSAANALVGHVAGVGLTGLGDTNELGYLGMSKTAALYTHSVGAVSFAVSVGQLGVSANSLTVAGVNTANNEDAMSLAVKYAADNYYIALGYESAKIDTNTTAVVTKFNDSQLSLGVGGSFNGFDVKFVAMDRKSNTTTHYALSAGYTMDALNVTAFYADKGPSYNYGIGGSYDLGGGAVVMGGVTKAKGGKAQADFGVSLSF